MLCEVGGDKHKKHANVYVFTAFSRLTTTENDFVALGGARVLLSDEGHGQWIQTF